MEFKYTPWNDVFHIDMVENAKFSSQFEFPILRRSTYTTQCAIPFEKALRIQRKDQWIHFYTHDRNFECLWRTPNKYLPILQSYLGVITPDYSLYREMPLHDLIHGQNMGYQENSSLHGSGFNDEGDSLWIKNN